MNACEREHVWLTDVPLPPLEGDRCFCGLWTWHEDGPPTMTTAPLPGHCGRCGKPWDSPQHIYINGSWVCLA